MARADQGAFEKMIGRLFPLTDDAPFLHPKEIAKRIFARFPGSVIDSERANRQLQTELEKLEALRAPVPVIEGHKNLIGKCVYVEVRSDDLSVSVHFVAYPDSPLELYRTPDNSTHDARKQLTEFIINIAHCLDYDAETAS